MPIPTTYHRSISTVHTETCRPFSPSRFSHPFSLQSPPLRPAIKARPRPLQLPIEATRPISHPPLLQCSDRHAEREASPRRRRRAGIVRGPRKRSWRRVWTRWRWRGRRRGWARGLRPAAAGCGGHVRRRLPLRVQLHHQYVRYGCSAPIIYLFSLALHFGFRSCGGL